MKLVFVDPEPPSKSGGGIRTYIQLMLELCRDWNIKTVVYSHNPESYSINDSYPIQRLPITNPVLRKLMYLFAYNLNVQLEYSHWLAEEFKTIMKENVRVEFCDFGGYGYYSLKEKSLLKYIIIKIHTPSFLITGKPFLTHKLPGLFNPEWYCLKHAENLITPSLDFVSEMLPEFSRAEFVPNPLAPAPGLKENQPVNISFIYVGRIEERKGITIMIEVFNRLTTDSIPYKLVLAGSWPDTKYADKLKSRINSINKNTDSIIDVKGELSKAELNRELQQATCCIIPSLWENAPYAFFESVNSGLYLIGSNTGEMGRFLRHIGGAVFDPEDAEGLYNCITSVIHNSDKIKQVIKGQTRYYSECRNTNQSVNKNFYLNQFNEVK